MSDPTRLTADELLSQLQVQFQRNQQLDTQVIALRTELAQAQQRLVEQTTVRPVDEQTLYGQLQAALAPEHHEKLKQWMRFFLHCAIGKQEAEAKLAQVEQERDNAMSRLGQALQETRKEAVRRADAEAELTALKARLTPKNIHAILDRYYVGSDETGWVHARYISKRLTDAPAPTENSRAD